MSGFRRGIRLAVDVGKARVGVAQCDPDGMLATPTETVARGDGTIGRLIDLVREVSPLEVIVGLPINLRGERTASTEDAVGDFASGESRDLGSGDASSGRTGGASTYSERGFDFFAGGGQDTAEAPLT